MKLSQGKKGRSYVIKEVRLDSGAAARLGELGMTVGTRVGVLAKKRGGTEIIRVRGTRFAVGKSFCEGIFAEEEEQ